MEAPRSAGPRSRTSSITLLAFLFVLSGMAGLIYESIWTRYLGLFVGHTAYAQILVLVIFLGGMSIGAFLAGRLSERMREPLLAYAIAEGVVGVAGLVFHPGFVAATGNAYDSWFPALSGTPWLPIVKWSLAAALILPQSVLLGTTFPLMTAAAIRRSPRAPGRMLGLFYFANSLGAAIGVLLSGFALVAVCGLPGTVVTAGLMNLLVAGVALALVFVERRSGDPIDPPTSVLPEDVRIGREDGGEGRREKKRKNKRSSGSTSPSSEAPAGPGLARLLLIVGFGTGLASFLYEIGWIRMLSLVLGSAAHSFEIMLSAFILGLALGSLWIRRRADRLGSPLRLLAILQWAMGCLAMATLPLYLLSFHWMSDLLHVLDRTEQGYRLFSLARYGICIAIMLPATFCAGTTLPLLTRSLMASGAGERAIGQVYAFNTLGSILGAGLGGLVLLPALGPKGLVVGGALLDVSLGISILLFARSSTLLIRVAAWSTAAVTAAVIFGARFDLLLLTSGVYRSGLLPDPDFVKVLSYRHGRTASISVERYEATRSITISTNGKGDASLRLLWIDRSRPPVVLRSDEATQFLIGLVALAHAPHARKVAMIGQGSGMSSHVLLGSPEIEELTTVEIEPEVLRSARAFYPANHRVYDDPRSRFVVEDAKSFFAASRTRYDLIVSEPSNPWVSGVAGLFSAEFYERVRRSLTPEGTFGQWLHLYELNDELALGVLSAIQRSFARYELFMVNAGDMLIVATNRPGPIVPDWSVMADSGIVADLRGVAPFSPNLFEAMRVGGSPILAPLVGQVEPNSDYYPRLDLGAEQARFQNQVADGFMKLHVDRFSLTRIAGGYRVAPLPSFMVPAPDVPRIADLALSAALRNPPAEIPADQIDPRLPAAIQRKRDMQADFLSRRPPSDWREWTLRALRSEEDWHLGSSGLADPGLYSLLERRMDAANAPDEAREAIRFMERASAWDLPAAAAGSEAMISLAASGQPWVQVPDLLDVAFSARLLTGDREGARHALERLGTMSQRSPTDLRIRLMNAALTGPEPAAGATGTARP